MFESVSAIVAPVARSFTLSTYWRRPTVSSAQATRALSGLTAQSLSAKKLWPFAIAGSSNSVSAGAVRLPLRRSRIG
jgi:hypothetical protein